MLRWETLDSNRRASRPTRRRLYLYGFKK